MACKDASFCRRPDTPLKDWMVWSHQVLRVFWVPPGEQREVLAGILGVSILVSMLVMFMFWHTSPVCKAQDACAQMCEGLNFCNQTTSPYDGMLVNIIWKNTSSTKEQWGACRASAQKWLQSPGTVRLVQLGGIPLRRPLSESLHSLSFPNLSSLSTHMLSLPIPLSLFGLCFTKIRQST